jgi:hypothetical protein
VILARRDVPMPTRTTKPRGFVTCLDCGLSIILQHTASRGAFKFACHGRIGRKRCNAVLSVRAVRVERGVR